MGRLRQTPISLQQKETEALITRLNEQEAQIQKVSGRLEIREPDTKCL